MTVRTPSSLACHAGKPEEIKGVYITQLARPVCVSQQTMYSLTCLAALVGAASTWLMRSSCVMHVNAI